MSDDSANAAGGNGARSDGAGAETGARGPSYQIHAQYMKDLSFENPKAPACYVDPKYQGPSVGLGVDVSTRALGSRMAEVSLHVEARAQVGEGESAETVYIVELVFAGIVQVGDMAQEQITALLLVEVPRMLFPYARNILCEATRDGGHSMLMMAPFDFGALYQRKMAERAKEAGSDTAPADPVAVQIASESAPAPAGGGQQSAAAQGGGNA